MIENNKRKEVFRMGKLIRIDFRKAIKIQDYNMEAIASEKQEDKVLECLENVLDIIDARDGLLNNEWEITQAKKLLREARTQNRDQLYNDKAEQLVLEEEIPMFA
jgi:hypothetical protein